MAHQGHLRPGLRSKRKNGNVDAEKLSRVRRTALMQLRQEKTAKVGVKSKRKKAGWDRSYLLKVLKLGQIRLPWARSIASLTTCRGAHTRANQGTIQAA